MRRVASPGPGGRTDKTIQDDKEHLVTRIAKLLAIAALPALLIATSAPLRANGAGGGGGGGGGAGGGGAGLGGGGGNGVGAGHGGGLGLGSSGLGGPGHGSSVSAATPGHAMQSALAPHDRGAHHGASGFTPGHAMQAMFPDPHDRGPHH